MKKTLSAFAMIALLAGLCQSCQRSSREVWEDTKTCSRYMGRGFRSLWGKHGDGRYKYSDSMPRNEEFIPLADNDSYDHPYMDDYGSAAPISRESPGDPGSAIPGIEGFATPSGKLATLFKNLRFETDQYTITGEENIRTLYDIANFLVKNPSTYVFIEGHADERGAAAYNLALGSRRSNTVRSFLIQNGVNPDQLFSISYGKERPIAQGHGENAWSENRRAQFKIYDR